MANEPELIDLASIIGAVLRFLGEDGRQIADNAAEGVLEVFDSDGTTRANLRVADGVHPKDAVNKSQLDAVGDGLSYGCLDVDLTVPDGRCLIAHDLKIDDGVTLTIEDGGGLVVIG